MEKYRYPRTNGRMEFFAILDFLKENDLTQFEYEMYLADGIYFNYIEIVTYLVETKNAIITKRILGEALHMVKKYDHEKNILNYLLSQCSIEQFKQILEDKDLSLLSGIINNVDINKYRNLIDACREIGIDIYDLIEQEI